MMNEGEVGKVEKIGGSRKKLIVGIVVAVMVVAGVGIFSLLSKENNSLPDPIFIYWDTENAENAWLVKVVDIRKDSDTQQDAYLDEIGLVLINQSSGIGINIGLFSEISNSPSPYGIMWIDVNNNSRVEIGDYLRVNKSGGSSGKIDPDNYYLGLNPSGIIMIYPSLKVYLPPADFLNMSVEKTSDGWNMTVTWVNESVPEWILNQTSFRLENESGEFFAIYEKNEIVGEWYTTAWLGGIYYKYEYEEYYVGNALVVSEWGAHRDMGYYNITWYDYDNDHKVSVNDSIIIDDNKGLVESGFKFKLTHRGYYGAVHVMEEIILP